MGNSLVFLSYIKYIKREVLKRVTPRQIELFRDRQTATIACLTFECPWYTLLSAGYIQTGCSDGVVTPPSQATLLMNLLEQPISAILIENEKCWRFQTQKKKKKKIYEKY